MINEQYARAKQLLEEHRVGHNELAELLITREVIFAEDVERIFGKRPWTSRSQEIIEENEKLMEEKRRLLAEKMAEASSCQRGTASNPRQDSKPLNKHEGDAFPVSGCYYNKR